MSSDPFPPTFPGTFICWTVVMLQLLIFLLNILFMIVSECDLHLVPPVCRLLFHRLGVPNGSESWWTSSSLKEPGPHHLSTSHICSKWSKHNQSEACRNEIKAASLPHQSMFFSTQPYPSRIPGNQRSPTFPPCTFFKESISHGNLRHANVFLDKR